MDRLAYRMSLGDTWSRKVHPDIESERCMPSFNVEQLTNILDGGAQNTALRRKVGKRRLCTYMLFFLEESFNSSPLSNN